MPHAAYRCFVVRLLALVLGVMGVVVAINITIDAAGVWGTPTWRGFNARKAQLYLYERMAKAQAVMRLAPRAIILGTSRARYGIDPRDFEALTGKPAYSLAMGNTHIVEQAAYFRHALFNQPKLSDVFLALDFQEFVAYDPQLLAQQGYDERRLLRSHLPAEDYVAHTLTWTGLVDSYETLVANRRAPDLAYYGPQGQDLNLPWHANLDQTGPVPAFNWYIQFVQSAHGPSYSYDPATMRALAEIVETCRARGIRLEVATAPVHAVEAEFLWATDGGADLEHWERDLARLTPFYDFAGFGPLTTKPIGPDVGYLEPAHYKKPIGRAMLARVYRPEQAPAGFGERVDASNVDRHLAAFAASRQAWLAANPVLARRLHQGRFKDAR